MVVALVIWVIQYEFLGHSKTIGSLHDEAYLSPHKQSEIDHRTGDRKQALPHRPMPDLSGIQA